MATEALACPHLVDSEVANALRMRVLDGTVEPVDAQRALGRWARLGIERFCGVALLERIWELRGNVTAYDASYVASYVAVAEAFDCELVTADGRLTRAPGPRCPVTLVRT
ncbi:MAG: type II toxin-antitoxin system VapC family toxin [Acidimicrobiales bacterium]